MSPRLLVGAAVAATVAAVAAVALAGPAALEYAGGAGLLRSPQQSEVLPLAVGVESVRVVASTQRAATVELALSVDNPNPRAVILQFATYEAFLGGERLAAGQIGERPDGFVAGSDYFTVLPGRQTVISEEFQVRASAHAPGVWEELTGPSQDWRVRGEAYFNLSSMTSGGENIVGFDGSPRT